MRQRHICPACLSRNLSVRLDKKGRPFARCEMCAQVIFASSPMKLFNMLNTETLLEQAEALTYVRSRTAETMKDPRSIRRILLSHGTEDRQELNAAEKAVMGDSDAQSAQA